jgi:hypothetical protein
MVVLKGVGKVAAALCTAIINAACKSATPLAAIRRTLAGFCGIDWRGTDAPPLTRADRWSLVHLEKALPLYQGVVSLLYIAVTVLLVCSRPGLALVVQVLVMAVLVLRGVNDEARSHRCTKSAAVGRASVVSARILAGIAVFAAVEGVMADAAGAVGAAAAIHLVFAFGGAVMSDYVCHRFIWHAAWSMRSAEGSWDRWMWTFVRGHHVQHYIGHHKHTQHPKADAAMRALQPVPLEIKEAAEAAYTQDSLAMHSFSASGMHTCTGSRAPRSIQGR